MISANSVDVETEPCGGEVRPHSCLADRAVELRKYTKGRFQLEKVLVCQPMLTPGIATIGRDPVSLPGGARKRMTPFGSVKRSNWPLNQR
jgi:hypothetical protein